MMLARRRTLLALLAWPFGCVRRAAPRSESAAVTSSAAVDKALAAEMRRVPITMYMTNWCPYCRRARRWLQHRRYTFVTHNVEEDVAAADALEALSPRAGVPTFDVDGRVVFGFRPRELEQAIRAAALARR